MGCILLMAHRPGPNSLSRGLGKPAGSRLVDKLLVDLQAEGTIIPFSLAAPSIAAAVSIASETR
jgi:hypothetical protein